MFSSLLNSIYIVISRVFKNGRLNLGVSIIKLMPDPKERDTFLSKKWVQTADKLTDRQTDIEHDFFEPSTQKAPSGQ